MRLTVHHQPQFFMPIKEFRDQFELPPEFGVNLFTPKDFSGLGSIEHAASALHELRRSVLTNLPETTPPEGWLTFALRLQMHFRAGLREVNDQIGLKRSEIEFAAAGFGEICQMLIHAALRARLENTPCPSADAIYQHWLNNSTAFSRIIYRYPYQGDEWLIQTIRTAYGRVGLVIRMGEEIYYVQDTQLNCPAEGFVATLFRDIAARIIPLISQENQLHSHAGNDSRDAAYKGTAHKHGSIN